MIDQYITKRYSFLTSVAKNIVSKNNRSKNKTEDASDLLSYTVEYFCSNRDKLLNKTDQDLENMMLSFMHKQWNWYNSTSKNSFLNQNRMIGGNGFPEDPTKDDMMFFNSIHDEHEQISIELLAENAPDNVKNYIQDLINTGYSDSDILKILTAKETYKKLNVSEQSLYDLYFVDGLAMRDIAKTSNVPLTFVFKMLKEIKEKIRKNYETNKT